MSSVVHKHITVHILLFIMDNLFSQLNSLSGTSQAYPISILQQWESVSQQWKGLKTIYNNILEKTYKDENERERARIMLLQLFAKITDMTLSKDSDLIALASIFGCSSSDSNIPPPTHPSSSERNSADIPNDNGRASIFSGYVNDFINDFSRDLGANSQMPIGLQDLQSIFPFLSNFICCCILHPLLSLTR